MNGVDATLEQLGGHHNCLVAWEDCYAAFGSSELCDDDIARELHLYLAAFGMLRSSSPLRQNSYRVHAHAVRVLKSPHAQKLRGISLNEFGENGALLLKLKRDLRAAYSHFHPTETLLTKILMGALGCCPAFDRYVVVANRSLGIGGRLDENSAKGIADHFRGQRGDIRRARSRIADQRSGIEYPDMRIVDMALFKIGKDIDDEAKAAVAALHLIDALIVG